MRRPIGTAPGTDANCANIRLPEGEAARLDDEEGRSGLGAEADMADPLDALILDLLEWIGPEPRPYSEVIEAWRTSCPRLPVWEEAGARGLIEGQHRPGAEATVSVTALGKELISKRRALSSLPLDP